MFPGLTNPTSWANKLSLPPFQGPSATTFTPAHFPLPRRCAGISKLVHGWRGETFGGNAAGPTYALPDLVVQIDI
jgi:hypothetical protein